MLSLTWHEQFLDEDIFVANRLSLLLLSCHLGTLAVLAAWWLRSTKKETGKYIFLQRRLSSHYIIYTLFLSNFVGICFARTLHYQFYSWYVQALPYLLWSGSQLYPLPVRVVILAAIEMSFLTFPATPLSSAVLQICHVLILLLSSPPTVIDVEGTKIE